jgi:hypothetical protein
VEQLYWNLNSTLQLWVAFQDRWEFLFSATPLRSVGPGRDFPPPTVADAEKPLRGMDDQIAGRIAREIINHLRLANWRFHRGPPAAGHSTPGPTRELPWTSAPLSRIMPIWPVKMGD